MSDATNWIDAIHELGPSFAERAAAHDEADKFVAENFQALKDKGFMGAPVPADLGGGGASYTEMCNVLRVLSHYCPSTSIGYSMHSHLVAANVWKHKHGMPGEAMLRKVAANNLVLISTGAGDWINSNGNMVKVEGGYKVTASKPNSSNSEIGDVIATSARYDDPESGPMVLHFPVPLKSEGVTLEHNWKAHGMRGSGSQTLHLKDVFVPDGAIVAKRPQNQWHKLWCVVLPNAMPLIMSTYVGVAEAAAKRALELLAKKKHDANTQYLVGEMENALATAQCAWESMVGLNGDYTFKPETAVVSKVLARKTIAAEACIKTAEKAMEAVGGAGWLRGADLERLMRDSRGGTYHPLPAKKQHVFSGRVALGLEPITGAELDA